MRSLFRTVIYAAILHPLIARDYSLREAGHRPDRWHWADELAMEWGFFGA